MPSLRFIPKILIISVSLLWAVDAAAEDGDLFTTLSRELERELSDEIHFLADSTCSGREFGTGGDSGAAFYIYRQLADSGYDTSVQTFSTGQRAGHNIVAVSRGFHSSYIVVGAYFDGIGIIDGVRYPGADTNASGVSAMLALARHFSRRAPAGTGFIFVAFDGHDADLAGSREFIRKYALNYNIRLMVNLDTMGSSLSPVLRQKPDYLLALGGRPHAESLEWANRTVGLHLSYDYYGNRGFTDLFYLRTGDQKWFLERGIPSVMFTSGITMHTNKPTDTADTIDYPLLVRRVRMIAGWLASMPISPK